jgi:hypothetical protein
MYTLLGYVLLSLFGAERVRMTEIASGPGRVEKNIATWTPLSQTIGSIAVQFITVVEPSATKKIP